MYLKHISLRNVRAFKTLELDLMGDADHPRMVTLIIGANGTGKSTLLRSIALGLAGQDRASALLSFKTGQYVGPASEDADITVSVSRRPHSDFFSTAIRLHRSSDGDKVRIASRSDDSFYPNDAGVLCGYGVSRSVLSGTSEKMSDRLQAVSSLFDYGRPLVDPELTLRRLKDQDRYLYDQVIRRVLMGVGLANSARVELSSDKGILVSAPKVGKAIPIQGLADGYKLAFAWIMDVYAWAISGKHLTADGSVRGILLLDEVEQHLHPSLQASALPRLRRLFPELQIIATTHSPLVALGTEPQALVSLARGNRRGATNISAVRVPNYTDFSSQDVLSHPDLFRTVPYSIPLRKDIEEYQRLLNISPNKRKSAQVRRLVELAQHLITLEVVIDYGDKLKTQLQTIAGLLEQSHD
jgi:predicted ATPase